MKKQAFSMVTAIIFIILVATVLVFTLSTSKTTLSFAARSYIKEQAEILMDYARSVALDKMYLSGDPNNKSGIYAIGRKPDTIDFPASNPQYKITIKYNVSDDRELLEEDKNTMRITVTVETYEGSVTNKIANIRLVRDFIIAN